MILPRRGEPVDRERRAQLLRALTPERVEQRIEELIAKKELRLHEVFSDEDVHRLCAELNVEFRERYFTPAVTLGLFVSQALSRAEPCSAVVTKFNRERKRQHLPPICEDASAYCRARAKLPVELIDRLSHQVVNKTQAKTPDDWKWNGLNVYLVDGLVLRAPDTAANQERYRQPSTQKDGLGFPQVRVVITTSLATGCILHYNTGQVEGKKTGEATLFREKHGDFEAGDVVVGDSNFESFHDAVLLKRYGVELVCCINGSRTSPFEGEACGTIDDALMTVSKPKFDKTRFTRAQWEALPESITYRVIRYRVSGRNTEITIVTTLLDDQRFGARDIADLYGLRWDVELDICSYKSTMGMGELRCHTPDNLDREIAVAVLGYNLVRLLMADTAAVMVVHPREISFSQARDAWRSFSDELETPHDLMWIILSASSRLVRDRPGREEPRALKKRGLTKYAKLKEPRPSRAYRPTQPSKGPPAKPPENP